MKYYIVGCAGCCLCITSGALLNEHAFASFALSVAGALLALTVCDRAAKMGDSRHD